MLLYYFFLPKMQEYTRKSAGRSITHCYYYEQIKAHSPLGTIVPIAKTTFSKQIGLMMPELTSTLALYWQPGGNHLPESVSTYGNTFWPWMDIDNTLAEFCGRSDWEAKGKFFITF